MFSYVFSYTSAFSQILLS